AVNDAKAVSTGGARRPRRGARVLAPVRAVDNDRGRSKRYGGEPVDVRRPILAGAPGGFERAYGRRESRRGGNALQSHRPWRRAAAVVPVVGLNRAHAVRLAIRGEARPGPAVHDLPTVVVVEQLDDLPMAELLRRHRSARRAGQKRRGRGKDYERERPPGKR